VLGDTAETETGSKLSGTLANMEEFVPSAGVAQGQGCPRVFDATATAIAPAFHREARREPIVIAKLTRSRARRFLGRGERSNGAINDRQGEHEATQVSRALSSALLGPLGVASDP
jgi:hypothetical protein